MSRSNNTLLIPLIVGMLINAILFYSNAYWLIPGFLHHKQLKRYWKWAVFLLLGLTLLELTFDTFYLYQKYIAGAIKPPTSSEKQSALIEFLLMFGVLDLFINILFWAMAFLYRMPKDWLNNERQKQQLVQDKLKAELDFLKAQINPHFLFNGINSIYHLMGEDVKKAQNILLEFSELLRYQLYECNENTIPLNKEIRYLKNYLAIETIRKGEDAIIEIDMPDSSELERMGHLKIAPLLFSPFLENAFKYLSLYSERGKNSLILRLNVEGNILNFFVQNSIDPSTLNKKNNSKSSGIGLENVKRRLALLYPNKNKLSIEKKSKFFEVNLKIDLS